MKEQRKTLQVLVATMNEDPSTLARKMNLQCGAVIANQCKCNNLEEIDVNGNRIIHIATMTRGVGVNRNIALHWATSDILLCSDDDVQYNDGYVDAVIKAFDDNQDADAIIFGMEITKNGEVYRTVKNQNKKLHMINALKYGTYVVAVKKTFIQRCNIHFSEIFGGGCPYGSGEDSMFILDLFRNRGKVYTNSYILGRCAKDSSTWFEGFTNKYFYDKGVWLACAFPRTCFLLKYYYAYRMARRTSVKITKILGLIKAGINGSKTLLPFKKGA